MQELLQFEKKVHVIWDTLYTLQITGRRLLKTLNMSTLGMDEWVK